MTSESTAQRGPIVPQHLVVVLPSTGEFDSRTYRIATTAIARGHQVTVIARAQGGLPTEELHPGGYRIVRVAASTADGLPLPGLRGWLGRWLRRRRGLPATPVAAGPTEAGGVGVGPDDGGVASSPGADLAARRRASLPRRGLAELMRRLAIPLTIRSHRNNARSVAPRGDLYHGMAYMGIPVALGLGARDGAPVVYDARDIYLEARNLARMRGPARWLLAAAERRWAHKAARVVTVNDAYADVLERRLRIDRPLVVMNCSYRYTPTPGASRLLHERLGLSPEVPVVLYHGGLFPDRGIEQLIVAMDAVPTAHLVLMGYGALAVTLPGLIGDSPAASRIHVLPAVAPNVLHDWVASADVAAMPIQPSTLNHRLTTPNKLFEAMAAGVPVVASDLPGMASIVRETRCGELCDPTDPGSIARAIRTILEAPAETRRGYGDRGHAAAHARYNWEAQATTLFEAYGRLTGRAW
jgi:glycosyltransferase involved in cell wall biosynthesis